MKGMQGLIVALILGVIGAMCNWTYLNHKSQQVTIVNFVGVKDSLRRGELITEGNLVPVPIPENQVGSLRDFAYPWNSRKSLVSRPVCLAIPEKSLLLRDHMRTPVVELEFGQTGSKAESTERIMWVPIDPRKAVASLISPGDLVSFNVPRVSALPTRAPATEDGEEPEVAAPKPTPVITPGVTSPNEIIGPFKVLALGNRLQSTETTQAHRVQQGNENVLAIAVTVDAANHLEPKAQRLWDLLQAANFQNVGVLLHPRKK